MPNSYQTFKANKAKTNKANTHKTNEENTNEANTKPKINEASTKTKPKLKPNPNTTKTLNNGVIANSSILANPINPCLPSPSICL